MISLFPFFVTSAEYMVPTTRVAIGCTVTWFLPSAKREQEINEKEAEMRRKPHNRFDDCSAEILTKITKGKS